MARLWDISQTLRPGLPVWPGDTAFSLDETWTIGPDCPVRVSRLTLSTHSGSHADAPAHYSESGADVSQLDLAVFCGPARLVSANMPGTPAAITPDRIDWSQLDGEARVLIRCYERFPSGSWDSDFPAIHPDTIDRLALIGCRLIGVDTASLDTETSKTMSAHRAVERHGMSILEGLVFDAVPDGRYELIALPLKIAGADAAPVRAVLRELA